MAITYVNTAAPAKPEPTVKVVEVPAAAPVKASKAKFDRNAYQREYMRKRRAAIKAADAWETSE